jgi:O-succinylbenzoic acid--CoA ligase
VGLVDVETDARLSYRSLDDAAWAVADWLHGTVDAERPTLAVLVDRRPAVPALLFGGFRAGARVAALDVTLPPAALAARVNRLDPDRIVCDATTLETVRSIEAPPVACVDSPEYGGITRLAAFDDGTATPGDAPARADDAELVAFTSGTTGEPKAVRLDLASLVASALASTMRLGVAHNDRWLVPIPTYHVGGIAPLLRCTQAGTTAVFQATFDAERTIEIVTERSVTCLSLVPTQVSRMLDAGWHPTESVRFVLVGGGPVEPALIRRCGQRGVPICPTYGTTETASQVATADPDTARTHPGTVGEPVAFTDVTILEDGEPRQPGTVGEVVVDGPTVTEGYLGADDATAFGGFGFHTADLGSIDDDGRLWIEGRLDDRIVTGGEVVRPRAVVDVIEAFDGVAEVAVVGIPDEEWGERVAALVGVEAGAAPAAAALRSHCRDRLPAHAVPKTVAFTEGIPRTATGTVDRQAVLDRLT